MSKPATDRERLAGKINRAKPGEDPISEVLSTSDRVLRRVTDGIYREPWSALRELVSNAYDADATEVAIETDAPRFHEISIRDDGHGFSSEALASMLKSIGGSTKRTPSGAAAGVTDPNDQNRSPGGRKLIGKMGIGLFAVSQLTHEFQIITKCAGESTRTVADVILFQHAESNGTSDGFETGNVRIWKHPARDKSSHGTTIVLRNLLPQTRAELASEKMWSVSEGEVSSPEDESWDRPPYHIGRVDPSKPGSFLVEPALPWTSNEDADARFRSLAEAMFDRANHAGSSSRPSLENTFDNYLLFLWKLSLAAPLEYLDDHPFDLTSGAELEMFALSNSSSKSAEKLALPKGARIRDALKLKSPERGSSASFRVVVDGVSLRRPIRFRGLVRPGLGDSKPLLFVGHCRPDLSMVSERIRGGDLEFEAYLLWTPRVVPVEHNGVLVRVNDASGTLFDSTFMDYRIAEQNRLRQVSAEIFVTTGLDAALNLDRESFNISHPHYAYIANWIHNAFKQFATRQKAIAKAKRAESDLSRGKALQDDISAITAQIVSEWTDGDEQPVPINFIDGKVRSKVRDALEFSRETVFATYAETVGSSTPTKSPTFKVDEELMKAVTQVLNAAGVFEGMSHAKQQKLLADLSRVIFRVRRK